MKLTLRFISFFVIGLFGFILYLGVMMALWLDGILPLLGIGGDTDFVSFAIVFVFSFVSGGVLFSLYFIKPLLLMLSLIRSLSASRYELSALGGHELYNKSGKLKKRFFLYREAIQDLYLLAEKLQEAENNREKLEQAKENWIRGVSHDLKTPLSYILGYSAILSNDEYAWDASEGKKFLNEIYSKGKYMEELIGDLRISFEQDQHVLMPSMTTSPFDFVNFLRNMIADAANIPGAETYDLSFQSEESRISIHADEKLLYRAFQNLLINAITHNPPETKIEVAVSKGQGGFVHVQVCDNGIGLTGSETKKVNNCENITGGGHGLDIVKTIITAHGGTISVDSYPNEGSVFQISLPKDR